MSRLLDDGSYIGAKPSGSSGIFGLPSLMTKASAASFEIVAGYGLTNNGTALETGSFNVEAGDIVLLFATHDGVGMSTPPAFASMHSLDNSVHSQIFGITFNAAGSYTPYFPSSGQESGCLLHIRGATLTGAVALTSSSSGNYYNFPALTAQSGPRIVIAYGALDDDKISSVQASPGAGYTPYAGAISQSNGSSTHVYAKVTDGSVEGAHFILNGGNDAWNAVILSLGKAT